jgi:hypothetical protein
MHARNMPKTGYPYVHNTGTDDLNPSKISERKRKAERKGTSLKSLPVMDNCAVVSWRLRHRRGNLQQCIACWYEE